jgi:hypothetical protein
LFGWLLPIKQGDNIPEVLALTSLLLHAKTSCNVSQPSQDSDSWADPTNSGLMPTRRRALERTSSTCASAWIPTSSFIP